MDFNYYVASTRAACHRYMYRPEWRNEFKMDEHPLIGAQVKTFSKTAGGALLNGSEHTRREQAAQHVCHSPKTPGDCFMLCCL